MKIEFSNSYYAKLNRLKRLPIMMEGIINTYAKRDAEETIKEFKKGIKANNFRLEPLKPRTIAQKSSMGYEKPRTPLYGAGEQEDKSYINMMQIRKIKKSKNQVSYKIYPSWAKHHKAKISLKDLFIIHEYGTTIRTKKGTIRIPARPAFFSAYRRYLNKRSRLDRATEIKKAITKYINTAREDLIKKIGERNV